LINFPVDVAPNTLKDRDNQIVDDKDDQFEGRVGIVVIISYIPNVFKEIANEQYE